MQGRKEVPRGQGQGPDSTCALCFLYTWHCPHTSWWGRCVPYQMSHVSPFSPAPYTLGFSCLGGGRKQGLQFCQRSIILSAASEAESKESHTGILQTHSGVQLFASCSPTLIYKVHFSLSETQLITYPLSDVHFDKAKMTMYITGFYPAVFFSLTIQYFSVAMKGRSLHLPALPSVGYTDTHIQP